MNLDAFIPFSGATLSFALDAPSVISQRIGIWWAAIRLPGKTVDEAESPRQGVLWRTFARFAHGACVTPMSLDSSNIQATAAEPRLPYRAVPKPCLRQQRTAACRPSTVNRHPIGTPRIASSDNVTESNSSPRRTGRDLSR